MPHLFSELFSRSTYASSSTNEMEDVARRHNEFERFTVAVLGFCLQHDDRFREAFLEKFRVCRTVPERIPLIFAEKHLWADLMIASAEEVHVFEAKVRARIGDRQTPCHPEFWRNGVGYGARLKKYAGVRRAKFWKLGWRENETDNAESERRGLEVGTISWVQIAEIPGGSIVNDFKSLLASRHLIPSSVMKKIEPENRIERAKDAAETAQVLANVFAHLQLPYSGVESDASTDGWWFQAKLSKPSKKESNRAGLAAFASELGSPGGDLVWIGYESNLAFESHPFRSVWFNCSDKGRALMEARLAEFKPDCVPSDGYLSVVVRSMDVTPDEEWFVKVLTAAGLQKAK